VRIALAGLGSSALRAHLPALAALGTDATLVAAADPAGVRRNALAAQSPATLLFPSAEDMLAEVDCDVLVVATTPSSHTELVALGMDRGLDVLCEKPLSIRETDHATIARACARRPDLAVVPVHQYRYSPQWREMARWARLANHLQQAFSLMFSIERPSTDPHAVSPWRKDIDQTGGMLADMGVHFLALAWTIDPRLGLLAAFREIEASGERSTAIYRVGSGVMVLEMSNGAPARHNHAALSLGPMSIDWDDSAARAAVRGRRLRQRVVPALSDRHHVDALYRPLYRDLARNRLNPAWRIERTAETLAVGAATVELLEQTPLERQWTPATPTS
jgi:predicted dehydrogenase